MFSPPGNVALYFRPLVNLGARRIIGFTAHSVRPGDDPLRAACRAAAQWPDGMTLGVALPPERWRNPAVGLQVFSAISESRLPPARLELEIGETSLRGDAHGVQRTIEHLRHAGVMVALTGCGRRSEVAELLPGFDTFRFNADLVQCLGLDRGATGIAEELIRTADKLGVVASADGISTETQLEILRKKGCASGQGTLFGKAVQPIDIPEMLSTPALAVMH